MACSSRFGHLVSSALLLPFLIQLCGPTQLINTNDAMCTEVSTFILLGVIMLFMELNDLSHSDEGYSNS
ncbi:hypothetical protein QTP88_007279 [Uroleucon formosanum]